MPSDLDNYPDLSIVITNRNIMNLLKDCLESIYRETKDIAYEIIVVDNASSDGSVEMLKTRFPQVVLIENKKDLFFSRANNQGLKIAQGRYLMILSADTMIINNALAKIVKFMDTNRNCGACGPKLLNPDLSLQSLGHRLPSFLYGLFEVLLINTLWQTNPVKQHRVYGGWIHNSLKEVEQVSGCCMCIRKEIVKKVGLLDENFLAYWEDADWCKRILKKGYKIYYLPHTEIIHYWQAAMSKLGKEKKEKVFYNSMLYYYRKHFGKFFSFILWVILNSYTKPVLKIIRWLKIILFLNKFKTFIYMATVYYFTYHK